MRIDGNEMTRRAVVGSGTGLLIGPPLVGLAANSAAAARGWIQPGEGKEAGVILKAGAVSAEETGGGTGTRGASAAAIPGDPAMAVRDPLAVYARPPFRKQLQEAPGLASKMVPIPDHGELSYRGSGKLVGRRALITGGDSGIGRAAAIAFAREGADVAINYLPFEQSDADEVIKLISAEGRKAVALPGDIRDEAFCRRMVAEAAKALGGLDILVNNAGQQVYKESLAEISTDQLESTFRTNVFAMVWITQAALEHLKPGSSIICTTSIQAYDPSPGILDYAMTKAANAIFVKGLSKQLLPKGIRVNGVAPGPIWTPLQPSGGASQEKLVTFGESTPFGRPGQPAELAATFVLLASQASSYVSGEIYGVTGGHPTA